MKTSAHYRFSLYSLLLGFLTLAAYAYAPAGEFLWDDEMIVGMLTNPHIDPLKQVFNPATLEVRNYFRPIANLSFVADFHIWGLNPLGFHLSNILYHLCVVLALFWVLGRHFSLTGAFWSAALFAVHPLHAETVTPVFSRCGIFEAILLPGLWLFSGKKETTWPRWTFHVLVSLVLFVLALLSKESAVVFPAILTLYFLLFQLTLDKGARWQKIATLAAFWVLALVFVVLRFSWIPVGDSQVLSLIADQPLQVRLWTFFESFLKYLGLVIFPVHLHMERHFVSEWTSPGALIGLAMMLVIFISAWRYRRTNPHFLFGFCWLLIWLSPMSNIVIPLPMTMAERWMYLPSIGLFWILADRIDWLHETSRRRRSLAVALSGLLAILMARTFARTLDWKDGATLYSRDLEKSPNSFLLHNNLGVIETREGRHERAHAHFNRAVEIRPTYGTAVNNLGAMEERFGNVDKAADHYAKAIQVSGYHVAYANLAKILLRRGDWQTARRLLEEGYSRHPQDREIYDLLTAIRTSSSP